jgi:hypothetical protein
MLMSPAGLIPEKDCAGDAQQQLKSTQIERERELSTSTNP